MSGIKNTSLIILSFCLLLMPVLKYFCLNSSIFDLGIFINHSFTIFSHQEFYRSFLGHSHLLSFLYSLLFHLFFKSPYVLLLSQSLAILSSLLFIYTLSEQYKKLHTTVFLLCYAVWYNALFDFHYDHLAIPLTFCFYWLVHKEQYNKALLCASIIPFIKEPFGLVAAFMGIYLALKGKKYLPGLFLFVYGLAYFYVSTRYVIPYFSPGYSAGETLSTHFLGGGFIDSALYPFVHFFDFVKDIFGTTKWLYLAILFASFGGIVFLFSPLELIPAIPVLGISLLSTLDNYYGYANHYTAGLVAPFMVAFIYGLPKFFLWCDYTGKRMPCLAWLKNRRHVLVMIFIPIVLSHILFSPSPFSRFFWFHKVPAYDISAYIPSERTQNIKNALKKYIPKDPEISVSSQNTLNWGYLAKRRYYFSYPMGVTEPVKMPWIDSDSIFEILHSLIINDKSIIKTKHIFADYVVVDFQRPLYLIDKQATREEFKSYFQETLKYYKIIYNHDGFYIMQRKK